MAHPLSLQTRCQTDTLTQCHFWTTCCGVARPGDPVRSRGLLTVRRVRAQPKVRFICERFVPHFVGECGCSESQVYIWWDFLSVSQSDHAMQKRQIECLPIFVAMSDAVCAARGGRGLLRQRGGRGVRRDDAQQGVARAGRFPTVTHGNE